jgi:F-type H+-transporting ATPase subunit epsilon
MRGIAVTLQVALVIPEGEIWSGQAQMIIAKTLEGDIGLLTGHAPVIGVLAEGSVVRIMPDEDSADDGEVAAAVSGGFLSVADDRVSVLAREAQLGSQVDTSAVQAALDSALGSAEGHSPDGEESAAVLYLRALLRAAGDRAA